MSSAMLNRFKIAVSTVISNLSQPGSQSETNDSCGPTGANKSLFRYTRPDFLELSPFEVQSAMDHVARPILVPRDSTKIPHSAGYAE